jgi:hypothetical protein
MQQVGTIAHGQPGTHGKFDLDRLTVVANELRLKDFTEASDAVDARDHFTVGDTVKNDSTIIITTTAAGEDVGIFRSRLELASCGVPALIEGMAGKPVGTKVTCQLNGQEHVVELLGIRNPAPVQFEAVASTDADQPAAGDTIH